MKGPLLVASTLLAIGQIAPASAESTSYNNNIASSSSRQLSRSSSSLIPSCTSLPSAPVDQISATVIDKCLAIPGITAELRSSLVALKQAILKATNSKQATQDLTLLSLQRQINDLRDKVYILEAQKSLQIDIAKTKEQEFQQTVTTLTAQVAQLSAVSKSTSDQTKVISQQLAQGTTKNLLPLPSDKAPAFKPTLAFSGSINMLYGGVSGSDGTYSVYQWAAKTKDANKLFSNESLTDTPKSLTGSSNLAGGLAYRYYLDGQSSDINPPNGLVSVDKIYAKAYAISSSWTGGKVKFDSFPKGGNLEIVDTSDPNYNPSNPRTLDRSGYVVKVDLKGQPFIPNIGLGGLIDPVADGKIVTADDFNLDNLGTNITFAGIPLGRSDVQNLIDLGNASRAIKGASDGQASKSYIVRSGDTISTISFNYGASATKILEMNPQLGSQVNQATILKQGTVLQVPSTTCAKLCKGDNQVANGGFVDNSAFYDDLLNIAVGEYGSLSTTQRNDPKVVASAQKFIRDLASSSKNDTPDDVSNNFQRSYTFNNDVKFHLSASFTGEDLLRVSLRYRNFESYGDRANFPAANLAFGFSGYGGYQNNDVSFDRLWWKLPVNKKTNTSVWVGTRYKDYEFLPVKYGTFYPVEQQNYFFASGAGLADYVGSGFAIASNNLVPNFLGGTLGFGAGYLANSNDALNPDSNSYQTKGLFGPDTRFRVPVQLGYTSNDGKVIASLNYIYSQGDTLNSFVGTNLSVNPFFYDNDKYSQFGLTFGWQFAKKASINLVYNNFYYTARSDSSILGVQMVKAGDHAQAQSWMAAFLIDDLLINNSKLALAIGQVPYVYSNDSAWGTDTAPLAFEAWYNVDLTDYISIQPGVFFLTNSDGRSDGGTDWGATFRVYTRF